MTKLNLTATTPEEKTVLEHLIPQASETLADKINNGVYIEKDGKRLLNKKDLTSFMQYATEQAKKTLDEKKHAGAQTVCVHGDDIMNLAIHYFEEDSIHGKLFNLDGTEYISSKPIKQKTKSATSSVPYTPSVPKPKPQMNIFDMLSDNANSETPTTPIIKEPPKPEYPKGSPMYQHYLSVKSKYKDCIVFYRLGDFYEMFGDDAITTAKELDLTLTGRDCGFNERVPMTGIPFHAVDTYVTKLVSVGYKVVICDPLEGNETIEKVITAHDDNRLVDVVTGEILQSSNEEIEEIPTVSKITGIIDDDDFDDFEQAREQARAFEPESMCILLDLFDGLATIQ